MIPDFNHLSGIPVLNSSEAEKWDKYSIKKGISSQTLMAWAGYAAFSKMWKQKRFRKIEAVHFLLGKGNNGGDGYVIAWHILNFFDLKVFFWQLSKPATKDAKYFYALCKRNHGPKLFISDINGIKKHHLKNALLLDCLFGTGFTKEIDPIVESVFKFLHKKKCHKISIDIPSGVFANGDDFKHLPFTADETYTFGSYKIGHLIEPGILYSGKVTVFPIGFCPIDFPMRRTLKRVKWKSLRNSRSNKYSSGVLKILGGSPGMEGAAIMSAYSFLRLGGGLAKIYSTSKGIKKHLRNLPEMMFLVDEDFERLEKKFLEDIQKSSKENVVLIGVGLGEKLSVDFWEKLFSLKYIRLILDGSVLNQVYEIQKLFERHQNQVIIMTPHAGEAKKILGQEITNIREASLAIHHKYKACIYLKGPGGMIIFQGNDHNEKPIEIYTASNQYQLATGGTGDVLAGILANMIYRYSDSNTIEKTIQKALEKGLYVYFKLAQKITTKYTHSKYKNDFLMPSDMIKSLEKIKL